MSVFYAFKTYIRKGVNPVQMRIALCDDEISFHETAAALLKQYRQTRPSDTFTLTLFSSGQELLDYTLEHGAFDIYLLDVLMPGQNGIETGAALRGRNDRGIIIYLTFSPDFAVESYSTEALHYLLKPVEQEQFFAVMDKAMAYFSKIQTENISVKTTNALRILPVSDILYAERVERCVCYYLIDNTAVTGITFNGTFQNAVAPLLCFDSMLPVGASFIVNLSHVSEITKSALIMRGGRLVPVPRRIYEEVKAKWMDYWFRQGECHVI